MNEGIVVNHKKNIEANNKLKKQHSIIGELKKDVKKNKWVYIMAIPVILYYLIFNYAPMYGALIAFKEFDIGSGYAGSEWVGFKHFQDFFSSFYFWRLLKNTLTISILSLFWGFPAPIILALLMNEIRKTWFKKTVQIVTYLPHFISIIVISGLLHEFLARDGFITDLLVNLGLPRTNLLGVPEYFSTIFISSDIWQQVGWGSVLYLAALTGIDAEQYEAAVIDGAGKWKQLIHVTIPGILPTIIIMLILRMGQLMNVSFEKIILLYSPATYDTADVISAFVYRKGLTESFEFSYTTAIGLFNSAINFLLLVISNYFSKKFSEQSLW